LVTAHLDAFNRHCTADLLAGLAPDARWRTGTSTVTGRAALTELFDDGLWAMDPSLAVGGLIAEGDTVAAQLREDITVDGARLSFPIAAFYRVHAGLISDVTIYREGSADLD
jgi:hypothetical protein